MRARRKKYQSRNSIGKAKNKKVGSAGKFVTRTMAVSKLQVSLKDFRKLCILKVRGIDDLEEEEEEVGGRCDATQDDAWAEGADLAHAESFC